MKNIFKIIVIIVFYLSIIECCYADLASDRPSNIESIKNNYLILLVHGTGDDAGCFNSVYDYLNKKIDQGGLDLSGYVYKYSFSDKFGSVKTWANELKSWTKRAKEDFKSWFHDYGPGSKVEPKRFPVESNGPDNEVPHNFILICHSAGGLAGRYYIMGRDESGNPLNEGNVKKIIMVDTPNLGSNAGEAAIYAEEHATERVMIPWTMVMSCILFPMDPELEKYLATDAAWAMSSVGMTEALLAKIDRHAHQPIVKEQKPGSDFLRELNSSTSVPGNYPAPDYSIIVGKGVPTASSSDDLNHLLMNSDILSKMTATISNGLTNSEIKSSYEEWISSMNLTLLFGYPFFDDGDFVGTTSSQRGEGVSSLSTAKIYEYQLRSPSISMIYTAADGIITAMYIINPQLSFFAGYAVAMGASFTAAVATDSAEYLGGHITMKDKIIIEHPINDVPPGTTMAVPAQVNLLGPTMLEQAIFDTPLIGGTSATSINQQPFILSTNITFEGGALKTLSAYHDVEIKSITEATNRATTGIIAVVNGQEKNIEAFTVKEAPTKIEGVLRDFMPLRMQYFQYSENFAAWKDIKVLSEYGNFAIDGLRLAEGQNVIAFRAKNKVGYTSNQVLNITVNTIREQLLALRAICLSPQRS